MNDKDTSRFATIMLGMADNFRDSISKEGMKMRFDMLKDFAIEQIEAASKDIIRTRKYTKMPPVAEFMERLEPQVQIEDKALAMAHRIIEHLKTHGSTKTPIFLTGDGIAAKLMSYRWPYQQWASEVLESELKWWVKEFCEAYRAYEATDPPLQIDVVPEVKQLLEGIGGSKRPNGHPPG